MFICDQFLYLAIRVWELVLFLADVDFHLLKSCYSNFIKSSAILNDRVCFIVVFGYYASMRCSRAFEVLQIFGQVTVTVNVFSWFCYFYSSKGIVEKLLKFSFVGKSKWQICGEMPNEVVGRWCRLFPTREVFQWETLHAKGKVKNKSPHGDRNQPKIPKNY